MVCQEQRVLYFKTWIHTLSYRVHYFLNCEMFQTSAVEKIETSISCSINFFFCEIRDVYLIHLSFSFLPEHKAIASSKASLPLTLIQYFPLQFTVSSPFLNVIHQLLTSSFSSSGHFYSSLYISSNNVSQKAVPKQDVTDPVNFPSFYCFFFGYFSPF